MSVATMAGLPPERILLAAIDVLKERDRCFNDYGSTDGPVCVVGALGVAGGRPPHVWESIVSAAEHELTAVDRALIAALRYLAEVVCPDVGDVPLDKLVVLVGKWHDGPETEGGLFLIPPDYSVVYEALTKAARLAEQAGGR